MKLLSVHPFCTKELEELIVNARQVVPCSLSPPDAFAFCIDLCRSSPAQAVDGVVARQSANVCPPHMLCSTIEEALETVKPLAWHSNCLVVVAKCPGSGTQVVVKSYVKAKLSKTELEQVRTW